MLATPSCTHIAGNFKHKLNLSSITNSLNLIGTSIMILGSVLVGSGGVGSMSHTRMICKHAIFEKTAVSKGTTKPISRCRWLRNSTSMDGGSLRTGLRGRICSDSVRIERIGT